ncbi:MAG: hypothetical protein JJE17_10830 [Peptostreptococcaceae bacterium]|nr:hypothetical protein [Peptostreptococcaceae bacterium]
MKKNTELREAAKKSGVELWEIVEKLCIFESCFPKKFMNESAISIKYIVNDLTEKLKIEKQSEI